MTQGKKAAIIFTMLLIATAFASIEFARKSTETGPQLIKDGSRYASPAAVDLGTAEDFVILTKSGISTTGVTHITGDIGVSPIAATAITGFGLVMDVSNQFSTSSLVTGNVYASNYAPPTPSKMTTAISDMQTAYVDAAGRTGPSATGLGAGDITSMTIQPGLYKWSTSLLVSAAGVTLNGSASDVIIFQIAQNLNIANGAQITLTGGLLAENVFWQVGGSTTVGTTAAMKGVILCMTNIAMNTGATLQGRALSQTAMTLNANIVGAPDVEVPEVQVSYLTDGYLQSAIDNLTGYGVLFISNGTHDIVDENEGAPIYWGTNVVIVGNGSAILNDTNSLGFLVDASVDISDLTIVTDTGIEVLAGGVLNLTNVNVTLAGTSDGIYLNNGSELNVYTSSIYIDNTNGSGINTNIECIVYINMFDSEIVGVGEFLIVVWAADVVIDGCEFSGSTDYNFFESANTVDLVITDTTVNDDLWISMSGTGDVCSITDSSMSNMEFTDVDLIISDTVVGSTIEVVSGTVDIDGLNMSIDEAEQGLVIGTAVTSIEITNSSFTNSNNSVSIVTTSEADMFINNTAFVVSTNASGIMFGANVSVYFDSVSWSLTSLSKQMITFEGTFGIEVYTNDPTDFSRCFVVDGVDSTFTFYNTFSVKTEENVTVVMKTSPSVTYDSVVSNEFGYSLFEGVPYGMCNETGYDNTSYIFAITIPTIWNMSSLLVRDITRNINITSYVSDRNITWTSFADSYVLSYGVNTGGLTYRYEDDNSSVSDNAIPGTVVVTENRIIVENKNTYRFYHDFVFGLFNFTGNLSNIDTTHFTLVVWKDAMVYRTINTTNGTVFFSGALDFGEEFWLQFQFSLKNYTITGVYSGRWAFGGKNDTQSDNSGNMGLTVKAVPNFSVFGTPVAPNIVNFITGKQAGVDTNYNTINELRVKNTGNTILGTIHINVGSFIGATTFTSPTRIKVIMLDPFDGAIWQEYALDTSGNLEISFAGTGTLEPIGMLQWRDFRFKMLSTPYDASGSYTSTLTVKVKSKDATTFTPTKTTSLAITLGEASVSIAITYNPSTTAPTTEATDNQDLGLQWSELNPNTVGANALSTDYFVVKNTGTLNVNRLIFSFEDLKHNDYPLLYQINIGGNAKLVTPTSEVALVRAAERGVYTADLTQVLTAGTGRLDFKVRVTDIGDVLAGGYGGGFSVTAIHTPLSREAISVNEFIAYGQMGSMNAAEDIAAYLSDSGDQFVFTSPIAVNQEAEQDLFVLNLGGEPINALRFTLSGGLAPAVYTIETATHQTYELGLLGATIPCEIQQGNGASYTLKIRSISLTYDPSESYSDQSISIEGIRYANTTEISLVAEYDVVISPVSGQYSASEGLNWFCMNSEDSQIQTASDLIALGGISWVGMWNTTSKVFDYYYFDGRGTDFTISYAQGIVFRASSAKPVYLYGTPVDPVSYVVPAGLQLVGNPSDTPVFISDMLENTDSVSYAAQYTDGGFVFYYPADIAHSTNFQVNAFEAIWMLERTGETDTVEY